MHENIGILVENMETFLCVYLSFPVFLCAIQRLYYKKSTLQIPLGLQVSCNSNSVFFILLCFELGFQRGFSATAIRDATELWWNTVPYLGSAAASC